MTFLTVYNQRLLQKSRYHTGWNVGQKLLNNLSRTLETCRMLEIILSKRKLIKILESLIPHQTLFQHQLCFAVHLTWNVINVTFIFATSPNTKPTEKNVGGTWHIMSRPEKVRGTRPMFPPPNCAHDYTHFIPELIVRTWSSASAYSHYLWLFVVWASCCCPLLGRTRFRGRCWAAIRLSHRPEPSGRAVHEEVGGLNIGGQHGRRFVVLRHTHRPQRRSYPICTSRSGTSDTGAEAVKPDPGSSWEGHSWKVGAGVGMKVWNLERLSSKSPFHWWSVQCAARMVLLSGELMSCCAASTNGCFYLRRRTFAHGEQISAEWSSCPPGSM